MKDLITFGEFAKLTNRTKQAVYQMEEKKLSKAVKLVNGKKYLVVSKLPDDEGNRLNWNNLTNDKSTDKTSSQPMIEYLKEQIVIKDKQIENLNKILINQQILMLEQSKKNNQGLFKKIKVSLIGEKSEKDDPEIIG